MPFHPSTYLTQAACALLLHYSVARLSWRTVKSLRRSRSRLTSSSRNDVSAVEYSVLEGWTIIAFHSLYVAIGVEYFVRFFIPFYFHFKMIFLAAAFVVPGWGSKGGRGEGGGLSPVISYCFDFVIVPGVHKMHELVDHDPKRWAMQQLEMLPLLLLDWFILPGVLATDEEKQFARERRREEMSIGEEHPSQAPPSEAFPPQITGDESVLPTASEGDETMQGGDSAGFTSMDTEDVKAMPEDDSQSAPMDTDEFSNVSYIQDSFARKYRKRKEEERKGHAADPPGDSDDDDIYATPPRGQKKSTLFSTPPRGSSSLFPRMTPSRTKSPKSASKKSFNSMVSPVMKSRLASSAMRLKRFSSDHRNSSSPMSTPRKDTSDANSDVAEAGSTVKGIFESPPRQRPEGDDEMHPPSQPPRRRRRERLSFGDHFRELVTGDANIRVRDHLFDLDLPTSPRRRKRTQPVDSKATLSPNITTRRSSRLAKKKLSSNI